jgi:hypothetical protein
MIFVSVVRRFWMAEAKQPRWKHTPSFLEARTGKDFSAFRQPASPDRDELDGVVILKFGITVMKFFVLCPGILPPIGIYATFAGVPLRQRSYPSHVGKKRPQSETDEENCHD